MELVGRHGFEGTELLALGLDVDVGDTDGLDADVLDVGPEVVEVADGVRLDDLCRVVVEKNRVSGCEVLHG